MRKGDEAEGGEGEGIVPRTVDGSGECLYRLPQSIFLGNQRLREVKCETVSGAICRLHAQESGE